MDLRLFTEKVGKRRGRHRGTGCVRLGGSGGLGHGRPKEAKKVIVIAEALEIMMTMG